MFVYCINMFEECLYFNSNTLARTVTRLWTEKYRQFGLTPSHAFLLRCVLAKPGMFPRELAEELNLNRSTITRFLDSLEKQNLLVRQTAGKDGREVQIFPTQKAKKIQIQLNDTGKELTQLMIDIMGKDKISETVSSLREIKKAIDNI